MGGMSIGAAKKSHRFQIIMILMRWLWGYVWVDEQEIETRVCETFWKSVIFTIGSISPCQLAEKRHHCIDFGLSWTSL